MLATLQLYSFAARTRSTVSRGAQPRRRLRAKPSDRLGSGPAWEQPAGHTWTWRLEPIDGRTTVVRQTYDWSAFRYTAMLDRLPVVSAEALRIGLDRLAELVGEDGR